MKTHTAFAQPRMPKAQPQWEPQSVQRTESPRVRKEKRSRMTVNQ